MAFQLEMGKWQPLAYLHDHITASQTDHLIKYEKNVTFGQKG